MILPTELVSYLLYDTNGFSFFLLKRRGLFNLYMNAYKIYTFSLLNPGSMLSTNYLNLNYFKATVTSWELCNCLTFYLDTHLSTQSIVTCLCAPILIQLLNQKFEESPGNNVTDMQLPIEAYSAMNNCQVICCQKKRHLNVKHSLFLSFFSPCGFPFLLTLKSFTGGLSLSHFVLIHCGQSFEAT